MKILGDGVCESRGDIDTVTLKGEKCNTQNGKKSEIDSIVSTIAFFDFCQPRP
jgi:hypothetical protein